MNARSLAPLLVMPFLLVVVEFGAILLSLPLQAAGVVAFQDPESVANPFIFIGILLGFTVLLLILIRYRFQSLITAIIMVSIFFTFVYIFGAITYAFLPEGWASLIGPFLLALLATAVLYRYPEWYVIDSLGVLIAAGVASIFGISLEIIPVIILLIILAVYDAISVYKTKHMITLAEGVLDMKTPILFVIPKRKDYSYIKEGAGRLGEGEERGAFIIGMGDLIMPSILVVSSNVFITTARIGGFITIPAIGAMIGSIGGLLVLLHFVNKGKPQAGLPSINGGAIIGFLIAYALTVL
jgi:presenilin-like A22 family membrane protease